MDSLSQVNFYINKYASTFFITFVCYFCYSEFITCKQRWDCIVDYLISMSCIVSLYLVNIGYIFNICVMYMYFVRAVCCGLIQLSLTVKSILFNKCTLYIYKYIVWINVIFLFVCFLVWTYIFIIKCKIYINYHSKVDQSDK